MKLYIDDIRTPKGSFDKIVRTSSEAINFVETNGCPDFISFDHDLGADDTSMIFLKWLINKDLDMNGNFIPIDFTWNVHSANPVGEANINGYLKSYMTQKLKRK